MASAYGLVRSEELLEEPVVRIAGLGDAVALAFDRHPLGPQRLGQPVADGVEHPRVAAGDDQRRDARRGDAVERDLPLPGRALAHRQLGSAAQRLRQLAWRLASGVGAEAEHADEVERR